MIVQIPFNGFYESIHDSMIDDELERDLSDDDGTLNEGLESRAYDAMNWYELNQGYAKKYAEYFALEFDLKITFESMTSPREYNFSTDRIFCEIEPTEVMRLFENVDVERLDKIAREMFTSCSGFISFYDNDWTTWGQVFTWDCNQLQALLIASLDADELQEVDSKLSEEMSCNGVISELLYTHCPILNRLNND